LIAVTTGVTGTITICSANCRNFSLFLFVATGFGDKPPVFLLLDLGSDSEAVSSSLWANENMPR
jgi:hypothetical protein